MFQIFTLSCKEPWGLVCVVVSQRGTQVGGVYVSSLQGALGPEFPPNSVNAKTTSAGRMQPLIPGFTDTCSEAKYELKGQSDKW